MSPETRRPAATGIANGSDYSSARAERLQAYHSRKALLKRPDARDLSIYAGREVVGFVVGFDSPAASHAFDADERHLGEFRTYRAAAAAVSARAAHDAEAGR